MSEAQEIQELAERLAREAGEIQRKRYETSFKVTTKSSSIDLVTEIDHQCEALIVAGITSARSDDAILSEEGGGRERAEARWRWVIDPLDGTTNYAHGYPRFCVSIGVECDGDRAIGVVYDPLLDELYSARSGGGATLNGRPIHVSGETDIGEALVSTGFAYDVRISHQDNVDHFIAFVKRARAIRRDGSAALDLCYVAAGRFDGFWELRLHAWDVVAGLLIVDEAGGRTSDLSGGRAASSGDEVVASNGGIHDAMLAILHE